MEVILKKPEEGLLYYDGDFKKLVMSLPRTFGFNEKEYRIKIPYNSTFDGGKVKEDCKCVLIFDGTKKEGKNIDCLKEYLNPYRLNIN